MPFRLASLWATWSAHRRSTPQSRIKTATFRVVTKGHKSLESRSGRRRVVRIRSRPMILLNSFCTRCVLRYCLITIFIAVAAFSQEYKASLSVRVSDPSYALVPQAHAILSDAQKQHVYEADTDTNGAATFAPLEPGNYSLEITKSGFDKISVPSITLAVRDQQILSLQLTVAAESSSVTVTAAPESVATDASMGVSLDQAYFENLPINGRSIDVLAKMAPGITSGSAGLGPGDGINANGLRSNTNYYTMDGVSLNTPVGGGPGPGGGGPFGGGGPPGGGVGGPGGGSGVSLDSVREVRIQT